MKFRTNNPFTSADLAVSSVKSGQRVLSTALPPHLLFLIQALISRANELANVEMIHLHTEGKAPYAEPGMEGKFFTNSLFEAANTRKAVVEEGRGDYIPIFLSECPSLFQKGILPLDVALIQISPPDKHEFCSLGLSVDISKAAVETANTVIAQVNVNMPRTHGDRIIHVDKIHSFVEGNLSLDEHFSEKPSDSRTCDRQKRNFFNRKRGHVTNGNRSYSKHIIDLSDLS